MFVITMVQHTLTIGDKIFSKQHNEYMHMPAKCAEACIFCNSQQARSSLGLAIISKCRHVIFSALESPSSIEMSITPVKRVDIVSMGFSCSLQVCGW